MIQKGICNVTRKQTVSVKWFCCCCLVGSVDFFLRTVTFRQVCWWNVVFILTHSYISSCPSYQTDLGTRSFLLWNVSMFSRITPEANLILHTWDVGIIKINWSITHKLRRFKIANEFSKYWLFLLRYCNSYYPIHAVVIKLK